MAKRAAWLLTVAVLSACGGGGDKDEIPPGTCRKASIPSTGPGDASSYFPAQVGWSWTYNQNGGGTVTVTGPSHGSRPHADAAERSDSTAPSPARSSATNSRARRVMNSWPRT